MSKPRIIVTCPETGITVISRISYEEMLKPRRSPMLFVCPCGETHKIRFAGKHTTHHDGPPPIDTHKAS